MSQSDDIALQISQMFTGPTHPYDSFIQDYLDRNPKSAAQTFQSTVGAPNANWDSIDTTGVGKNFGVGFFVQDQSNGALYRCLDATPKSAVWKLVIQENI